jgi:hypothetical protein
MKIRAPMNQRNTQNNLPSGSLKGQVSGDGRLLFLNKVEIGETLQVVEAPCRAMGTHGFIRPVKTKSSAFCGALEGKDGVRAKRQVESY